MSNTIAFAWTSLLIELTPGPNMTYLALLTLAKGRVAGLAAVAGIALGLGIIGAAAALGVGSVISKSPFLYETIRIGGVLYLCWLAWETWRGSTETSETDVDPALTARDAFKDGLITNLLNPKAAMFYIAILPVFLDPARVGPQQAIGLTAISLTVATAVHLAIVILATQARPLIVRSIVAPTLRRAFGLMLFAVALWMAWATRR
jgi:threonine/homoserine/homoserine lactone efflux protein